MNASNGKDLVLEVEGLNHWFGPKRVLHDIDFQVVRGEIVGVVGPSGCGKSTLLRAIVGTHLPREGKTIVYSGADGATGRLVRGPGRDRGIVYQKYSLFPFLTALDNVAFGLMLDETSPLFRAFRPFAWRRLREEHRAKASELLERVGLGSAACLYPGEMSGGMQQRVAIAQALIMKPALLLLDEPFGALDEAMRGDLQRMLLTLYAENVAAVADGRHPPYTILIVTHELNEAIYVGDRVIGLSQYWDWASEGHAACPGATVVYDRTAPVERPDEEPHFEEFRRQREEIRAVVFDPNVRYPRNRFRTFWDEIREGKGEGVLA